MDGERESVWLAVPFTVGVATVIYSLKAIYVSPSGMAALCAVCVLPMVFPLWFLSGRASGPAGERTQVPRYGRFAVAGLYFVAGAAVALISSVPVLVPSGSGGQGFLLRCAEALKALIDSIPYSEGECNALVKAFLTGDRSSLSAATRDAFRQSGASHLLALSGMHLSIIYLVFSKVLGIFGNAPPVVRARSAVIVLGSGFFTVLTGAAESLVRAFFFITLRECARIWHRKSSNINIICIALVLQLALDPQAVTSVGFQLSYLAMLGIFVVYPPLDRLWERTVFYYRARTVEEDVSGDFDEDGGSPVERKKSDGDGNGGPLGIAMRRIWSMCALSLACQTFTAPAVMLYFGSFPVYFLVTNLLCIPLSNAVMTLAIVTLPLQAMGICPELLVRANELLLKGLIGTLEIISSL